MWKAVLFVAALLGVGYAVSGGKKKDKKPAETPASQSPSSAATPAPQKGDAVVAPATTEVKELDPGAKATMDKIMTQLKAKGAKPAAITLESGVIKIKMGGDKSAAYDDLEPVIDGYGISLVP